MTTFADAILKENIEAVQNFLHYREDVNQIDEYGFTPLIEAAIVENIPITKLLLAAGANPNQQDVTGGTPLHWAAENNNLELAKLLLDQRADPNAYNLGGQPVLVMPTLRRNKAMRSLLIKHGADDVFNQDFINAKLLGHMFELIGTASIVDPQNEFVELDFEGFYLEITLGLIANSLAQFHNHFAARQLRRYAGLAQFIVQTLERSQQLIKYQQYRVNLRKYEATIDQLIAQEPLVIPVGYEGHAITFTKYEDIWVKCDRREDSRLYDNIMFYQIGAKGAASANFVKNLMYAKQSSEFVNTGLDHMLSLSPFTELKVEAQISGNCSWANVEAVIPSLFFLVLMQMNKNVSGMGHFKTLALNFFHRWREWNRDRALRFCLDSFHKADPIRKASKAEILAAILFQRLDPRSAKDQEHIQLILSALMKSPYEYILKNYLRVYYYESGTEEGRRFAELLKQYE